jgi:hypothetical protein
MSAPAELTDLQRQVLDLLLGVPRQSYQAASP